MDLRGFSASTAMRPNDIFKRPGPHRAHEVNLEKVTKLRRALDALESLGVGEPLAELVGAPADEALEHSLFEGIQYHCVVGDNFGLAVYGPMLSRAGLQIVWGEPLFRERDPRKEPISMFWADRRPYLPQHVARAADILSSLDELRDPPAEAWQTLLEELADDEDDDLPAEERPQALVATWRRDYLAELAAFSEHIVELARRDASVMTWEDEQGWL